MNISPGRKKWLKATGIFLAVLLLIAAVLYYTIAFRFRETIQFIVDKESNGVYSFNASAIEVSLAKRQIVIRNASFVCKDTAETTPHYDVKVPDIFLSVQSLREMVFTRKLTIDSLAIALPQLKIHEHTKQDTRHAAFHASKIFEVLQKLKSHLQVKSFSIHKASFDYGNVYNPNPFRSNRISVVVKNFSKDNNPDKSFLSSEDVDLSILNQNWKLPDGLHEISFTNLHFSGSSQFFEIDSCVFKGKNKQNQSFSISAQKLFFNSTQLADFYNKEELVLDTLLLHKPVIYLETSKKEKNIDSTHLVSQSFKQLFKIIQFRYIDITGGDIQIMEKNTQQQMFASNGTNFKVYNLLLNKDSASVKVDSIALQQKNISFITRDSLFKLNIEEFAIENNAVYLRNATYEPTEKNHNTKIFTFRSPLLKLTNVNLEDLLEKKLNATEAELHEPQITFKTVRERKKKNIRNNDDDKFYTTLHGLSELILVQQFRIIKGNLHFQSAGVNPMHMRMENINSLILLDRFFSSDSLIDVKRSLPIVSVGKVNVQSQKVKLNITDFIFQGEVRHNRAAALDLDLANGTSLKGKDLSWVIFDWDMYRNHKVIQVNTMRIKELAVATRKNEQVEKGHVAKDLPVIHLDRIDIDKLSFDQASENGKLSLDGEQVCVDDINSLKQAFTWGNAEGMFKNIVVNKSSFNASIQTLHLNTQSETVVQNTNIEIAKAGNHTKLAIPRIHADFQIHSSDFSHIRLASVNIKDPTVTFDKLPRSGETATAIVPVSGPSKNTSLSIAKLNVEKATIHYQNLGPGDSMTIKTGMTIHAENIRHDNSKTALLSWKMLGIQLLSANVENKNLNFLLPAINIAMQDGNINKQDNHLSLHSRLAANWNNANISLHKDETMALTVEKLSGNIEDHPFSFHAKEKILWENLMGHLSLHNGAVSYKNKKSTISADGIRYDGLIGSLNLGAFKLSPNTDAPTLFRNTGWQTDHTSLFTGAVQINGIKPRTNKDSVFRARKVVISDLKLTTIKDKRYPFKHGIEKPMLARMINNLKFPLDIDSVQLKNGSIYVHEITEKTHKEAVIPLEQVNAIATHVRNRNNSHDSLVLDASLRLFNTKAHYFHYREAYGDSLSSFTLRVGLSPVALPELSQITMPFANINVISGKADTVFASWTGNKYAAAGKMNFIYDGLKIKVMSKKDSTRTTLLGRIESFLANDIALHKRNKESAPIFFVRDQEKSVFNFWVKTKLTGVIASAAILQRKKQYKEYIKYKEKYYLPDIDY